MLNTSLHGATKAEKLNNSNMVTVSLRMTEQTHFYLRFPTRIKMQNIYYMDELYNKHFMYKISIFDPKLGDKR